MLPRIHLRLIGGLAILLAFTGLTLTGLHSAQAASPARRDCVLDATSGAERCFGNYRAAVSFATDATARAKYARPGQKVGDWEVLSITDDWTGTNPSVWLIHNDEVCRARLTGNRTRSCLRAR